MKFLGKELLKGVSMHHSAFSTNTDQLAYLVHFKHFATIKLPVYKKTTLLFDSVFHLTKQINPFTTQQVFELDQIQSTCKQHLKLLKQR